MRCRSSAQVAAALDAAHANGLVHRDIKPENVLLTPDDFAYLVDFGIAHGGGEASVTRTGLVIGSCAYMAAERFSGGRGGPAADVYSLTCLLYECLTGRAPFEAGDLRQMMSAHMFSPPPRPSIMRRGISRAFDDVIAKGMAKKPADRYASAGELAKAAADAASRTRRRAAVPALARARRRTPGSSRRSTRTRPRTGYTPYAPLPPRRDTAAQKSRFGPTQVALVVATIVLFAAAVVLAAVLVFGDHTGGSAAADQARCAAAEHDDGDDDRAVDVGRVAVDHVDHTDARRRRPPSGDAHPRRVGNGRAGLRRPYGALRRREARRRRRSEPRSRWRWCASRRRGATTTAANG